MLAAAERPIFYTGGGVINSGPQASALLRELAVLLIVEQVIQPLEERLAVVVGEGFIGARKISEAGEAGDGDARPGRDGACATLQ